MKNERGLKVAQDILNNLHALRIREGHYLNLMGRLEVVDGELQEYVDDVQKVCEVCLLGACLLSKARVYDAIGVAEFVELEEQCCDEGIRNALGDVFDTDTLNMFEAAFERYSFSWGSSTSRPCIQRAIAFGEKFNDPKDRVKAVMQNYINNGGKFVP